MSDTHNEKLKKLAIKSNANLMTAIDAFVQGFIMGRNYEREFNVQLHNSILREMNEQAGHEFNDNNYWDNEIDRLEKENFDLKAKYVWETP